MITGLARIGALCLIIGAGPLWAQDTDGVADTTGGDVLALETAPTAALPDVFEDQAEWDAFSERAGQSIAEGRASNAAFADLRDQLADWRDVFLGRQTTNAVRIETVRDQIAALGAAPEDGAQDPRIVARRAELTARLQLLETPARLASEAYTRANGLIGEIDSIIRARQAQRFTQRGTSPLNPTGWPNAVEDIASAMAATGSEVVGNAQNPSRRAGLWQNLPAILALLAVAGVLVIRGRRWFEHVSSLLEARTRRGHGVVRFVLSLGQIIVPVVGLMALSQAFELTTMLGRRSADPVAVLPLYGLLPILAHWVSGLLMPHGLLQEDHPLKLTPEASLRAGRRFVWLGYALMAFSYGALFAQVNALNIGATAVLMFPLGLLVCWTLYWLGHRLRHPPQTDDEDSIRSFRQSLRTIVSRGLRLAAVAAVVLAALGYSAAFETIPYPAALTLYVLAILLILQRLSVDAYTVLSKSDNAAQDALIPVLIGFALIIVTLPILAVIWGAQVTELTELWARFREGFAIGSTRISPSSFLTFAVIFGAGYTVTRMIQAALRSTVLPRTRLDIGGQNAIVAGMGYVGILLAALVAITMAGIDLSGLAIVAGALSVGIGFGLQNIVSNFVAGIILLIERPISEGDWIEVGGQMGYVRDISVRSTRIETFDKTDVIVPNADLVAGQVTNWTRGNSVGRVIVPVGVAYGTDTDVVTTILREIAEGHPMVLAQPGPSVLFRGFGADSLDFEIRAYLRDVNWVLSVHSDMNHAINTRFTEAGIEIPFAQRDLWLRNPETLTPRDGGAGQTKTEGSDT